MYATWEKQLVSISWRWKKAVTWYLPPQIVSMLSLPRWFPYQEVRGLILRFCRLKITGNNKCQVRKLRATHRRHHQQNFAYHHKMDEDQTYWNYVKVTFGRWLESSRNACKSETSEFLYCASNFHFYRTNCQSHNLLPVDQIWSRSKLIWSILFKVPKYDTTIPITSEINAPHLFPTGWQ